MNINFRLLILFLVALGGFFLGGEVAVRINDWRIGYPPDSRNLLARPTTPIIPYRVLGWNLYHFNNDEKIMIRDVEGNEYPFQKNAGTFRVVIFGEGVPYVSSLRARLHARFPGHPIEIINVNHDTYAFPHSLTLLAFDVLSWQPDLLIASHNFNDREAAYFPNPLPDYSNKYGTEYFMPNYPNPFTASNYLLQWSRLYWVLKNFIAEQHAAQATPSRVSMPELPELSKEIFERNLRTFIVIAQSRAIPLILATQPINNDQSVWDIYLKSRPYRNEVIYPLHEEFLAHHQLFNDIMNEQARIHGVPVMEIKELIHFINP